VKLEDGKCRLEVKVLPDPAEAKRLWLEGKSAQWILEQASKRERERGE
jgi:hypothetical protein